MTDHSEQTMAWREEKRLDYLERIAEALEKLVEKPDPETFTQYIQSTPVSLCDSGPCIRPKNHGRSGFGGGHQDKSGGEW